MILRLRCSSDTTGYKRCLPRNLDCQYPRFWRNGGQKNVSSLAATPLLHNSSNGSGSSSGVFDGAAEREPVTFTPSQNLTSLINSLSDSSSAGQSPLGFGFDSPGDDLFGDFDGFLSDGRHTDNHFPSSEQDGKHFLLSSALVNQNSEFGVMRSPVVTEPICICLVRAINAQEHVEMAIWQYRKLSYDTERILQHQKIALTECAGLVECFSCSTRSASAVMLITMCYRIQSTSKYVCRSAGTLF